MEDEKTPIILIIDDEDAIRDSCSKVLIKEGYQVEVANDGTSGLKKARLIGPDLALVDLKMPGLCGPDLLEELTKVDPFMAKVVITGYPTVSIAVEAMQKGAFYFLPKPFDPEELRSTAKDALIKRREVLKKELVLYKNGKGHALASRIFRETEDSLLEIETFFSILEGKEILRGDLIGLFLKAKTRLEKLKETYKQWLA